MSTTVPLAVYADGIDFPTWQAGTGVPLVLLHGGGSRALHFRSLIPLLAPHFRVIAYDQRGFGGMDLPDDVPIDHEHWASDLVAILDAMGIARAMVLGWSMGCSVAINVAAQWPDRITGIMLVSAPDPGRAVDVAALRARVAEYEKIDDAAMAAQARDELAQQLTANPGRGLLDALVEDRLSAPRWMQARAIAGYATRPDLAARASEVSCPAFLVTGERDAICPPAGSRVMADALGAPPPDIVPGYGHYIAAECPDTLAGLVISRLRPLADEMETA